MRGPNIVNDTDCIKKRTIFLKNNLQEPDLSYILNVAVTLIAMKREVAARCGRFSAERMSS